MIYKIKCFLGRHAWFFQAHARINPYAHYFTYFQCVCCGKVKSSGLAYTLSGTAAQGKG